MQLVDQRDQVSTLFAVLRPHGSGARIDRHLNHAELVGRGRLNIVPGEENTVPVQRPFEALQSTVGWSGCLYRRHDVIQGSIRTPRLSSQARGSTIRR